MKISFDSCTLEVNFLQGQTGINSCHWYKMLIKFKYN